MRPSSLGGGRILRRTLSVRLSVCPSVRPSRYRSLPSVTSRHLANYNDTHVRAAYRTAMSAALVNSCFHLFLHESDKYTNMMDPVIITKREGDVMNRTYHAQPFRCLSFISSLFLFLVRAVD